MSKFEKCVLISLITKYEPTTTFQNKIFNISIQIILKDCFNNALKSLHLSSRM